MLHEFFHRSCREFPHAIALDIPPGPTRRERVTLTYHALAARSRHVQALLAPRISGESLVAMLLPRTSADAYAAQLAVLQSGAAFLCLDPAFPDERIAALLADAEPVAVVTNAAGAKRLTGVTVASDRLLDVDAHQWPDAATHAHNLAEEAVALATDATPAWLTPSTLAYVVYTSGTTGQPKGVAVEHRAIVNLIASDGEAFGLTPGDRVGQGSSHAYDSSIEEMWMAWSAGAAVVVMDDTVVRSGPALVPWLERERLTVLCPPPTLLRSMGLRDATGQLPRLSLLYVGGEALPPDVVHRWAPGRRLVNGYGPTECAVTTLRTDITPSDPITIGTPIPGVQAWVLDASLEVVPDGEPGELCLGGAALARGYWRDPALTARKFIEHPTLGRLYRTGDVAHRAPSGHFLCHGRTDSQVKIRGYRVELEEIEAHLSRVPGVREAACLITAREHRQQLIAFLVADNPATAPTIAAIRDAVNGQLPAALVPSQFLFLDALPVTVGGKLHRASLAATYEQVAPAASPIEPPSITEDVDRDPLEGWIHTAMQRVLRTTAPLGARADFFAELGGDSLAAAELVTILGERPETEMITVSDLYGGPTVEQIAQRAREAPPVAPSGAATAHLPGARPVLTTTLQASVLVAIAVLSAWMAFAALFRAGPAFIHSVGLLTTLVIAPLLGLAALGVYGLLATVCAVLLKRVLIGRYVAMRTAVWSPFYLRHWIVQRAVAMIPWSLIEGTQVQIAILRALGARIGVGVHLHRGVRLADGGWDLLDIGDHVSIGQDAHLHLTDLAHGALVFAPIRLESGATLEVRSSVGGNARVGANACLTALSWLPQGASIPPGEQWAGVPAEPNGAAPAPPVCPPTLSPWQFDRALLGARAAMMLVLALPYDVAALAVAMWYGASANDVLGGTTAATAGTLLLTFTVLGPVPLVCTLAMRALMSRALGAVPVGRISRWSGGYVRVLLKTELLTTAGHWLSGTLMWPMWLRAAGMRVGRDCEISTIIDVIPEHVSIGASSFLADGIYLGGPRVSRGTVTLQHTALGSGAFVGNHAVVHAGQHTANGVLIGVATMINATTAREGTAWFGQPAFALRRRTPDDADRHVTHEPSLVRYLNRWCWELLRFALPVPLLAVLVVWSWTLGYWSREVTATWTWLVLVPTVTMAAMAILPIALLALKWVLLGRVQPGSHPLWSCWCSRWDFLYVAWGQLVQPVLVTLEGTLLLSMYLRRMGMTIGRRVVLGPGFSQVVDPDMLHFGDDATVQCMFQAHTFEDRILKIDTVHVGAGATLGHASVMMNGSAAGDATEVAPHTVVMKHARLRAGRRYEGCPSRLV